MGDDRPERDGLDHDVSREVLAEAITQLERENPVYRADFRRSTARRWRRWPRVTCGRW